MTKTKENIICHSTFLAVMACIGLAVAHLLIVPMLLSQTPVQQPQTFNNHYQVTRQIISTASPAPCIVGPNSACNLVVKTANGGPDSTPYLCSYEFANATGQTITMCDGNANCPVNGVLGSSGTPTSNAYSYSPCVAYPGGLFLNSSGSGPVVSLSLVWNK